MARKVVTSGTSIKNPGFGRTKFSQLDDGFNLAGQGGNVVVVNPGGTALTSTSIGIIDDHKVIVAGADTTPGYLSEKIVNYSTSVNGIAIGEQGIGNQKLIFSVDIDGFTIDLNNNGEVEVADLGITDGKIATANKDGLANVPSMRTLGTGAQQAAPGNIIVSVNNAIDEAAAFAAGSIIVIRTDLL